MSDLKKTICRSFERTIQVEQYQPAKFWASYCEEVDAQEDATKRISQILYDMAKGDVEESILNFRKEIAAERIVKQAKETIKSDSDLDL